MVVLIMKIFVRRLMNSLLLDTNVLIYIKDRSSIFHSWAKEILQGECAYYTTRKNLAEYYAVTTKGAEPALSPEEALADLKDYFQYCQILFPDQTSHEELVVLIAKDKPTGLKVHDYEIAAIAIANGIRTIATNNPDDFKRIDGLQIISPG